MSPEGFLFSGWASLIRRSRPTSRRRRPTSRRRRTACRRRRPGFSGCGVDVGVLVGRALAAASHHDCGQEAAYQ